MKRKGHISSAVATPENFERGFRGYSANKYGRHDIDRFAENLEQNLAELLRAYATCSYRTSGYEPKEVR